jgi:outer membrane protein OmpA-like peptidoglycan-associated protein
VGLGSATIINSNTTSAGVGTSFSATSGGTTVSVTYIADALPAGTVIDAYLLPNTNRAAGLIPDANNLLLSLVVAWKATDGTVPTTAAGSPITVTITNSAIKAGAKIYCLIGDTVTLLGTATVDGTATANFSDDPEIVIANPPVSTPPPSGGGSSPVVQAPAVVVVPVVETPTAVIPTPPLVVIAPPLPLTPSVPTSVVPNGQALVEIRNAAGIVSSTKREVFISPTVPNTQVVRAGDIQMTLSTENSRGASNKMLDAMLTIAQGDVIKFTVSGFKPNSEVAVYIFSEPILLGKVISDKDGNYAGSFPSPSGLEVGNHTVQLVGYLNDDSVATLSLPVLVVAASTSKVFTVFFEMGSAKISTAQGKSLKSALLKTDRQKIVKIAIKGYVQKTVKQVNDKVLPQLRAKSVAAFLKGLGITIKPSLLSGGYASELSASARRVEITITYGR